MKKSPILKIVTACIVYAFVFFIVLVLTAILYPSDDLSDAMVWFMLLAPAVITFLLLKPSKKEKDTPAPSVPSNDHIVVPAPKAQPVATASRGIVRRSTFDVKDTKAVLALDKYAVIDVETTGLSRSNDKIIEIGIVTVENGNASKFVSYVNPEMHIPAAASRVNGIYDRDVENAPTYKEISPIIYDLINDRILIAHNASFDMAFLENLFISTGVNVELKSLDTLSLSRRYVKDLPDYKLTTLIEHFDIDHKNAHRAGDDAYATMQMFECVRTEIKKQIEKEKAERKEKKAKEAAERKAHFGESPLFETIFVFTGEFKNPRRDLEDLLLFVGALKRESVSGKTNYLVVGDMTNHTEWSTETKLNKAKELNALGKGPQLITEDEYIALINQALERLKTIK